ncbi:hypothetical protein BLA14095_05190 [Burkholderia lata]|nr:hypothetical protein BLA14095_05190 [Burkholderia lata]
MMVIGVTSLRRRGYVAVRRGYIALSRGYVAHSLCNSLSTLVFSTPFRLLPFSYLLSTSRLCGQVRRSEERALGAKGSTVRSCGVVGHPTGTFRKRRRSAPSARRATGSSALRAAESYRTGPYRLGGCAASQHGAVKSRRPANVGKVLQEEGVSTSERLWLERVLEQLLPPLADISLWGKGPSGPRQARRASSRGAGGRLRNAGQRAGAVHALAGWAAQPSTGGRGNDDRSGTTPVCGQRTTPPGPNCGGHDSCEFSSTEHTQILISNVPKSCRSLVRTACRTRGGLAVLGRNTDMRRHGVLRPKTAKPQPLRGRAAEWLGGGLP